MKIVQLLLLVLIARITFGASDAPSTQPGESVPIINTLKGHLSKDNRPAWCNVTGAGVLRGVNSGHFDRHFHDCNEYWMVIKGKAKIWIDGKTHYVHDGDIVCIEMGLEHDILELYEPLQGFFMEDVLKPGGKAGHLHKSDEAAKGHDVPTLPVPADFPKD